MLALASQPPVVPTRLVALTLARGLALALTLAWSAPTHAEPTPRELAESALGADRLGFGAGSATLGMELRDKAGRIISRKLEARSAIADGTRKMRLSFLEPIDQRGIEYLLVEKRGAPPLQYLWLPKSAELRRVTPDDREGRLGGSDFSFADFEKRDFDSAEITRLPDEDLGGQPCYRLAITPKPGTRAPGGWARVTTWILKDGLLPVRLDFERTTATGLTVARRLEVKRVSRVGSDKRLVPTRLVMTNLVESTRTTLDITAQNADARFPDAIFQPESLGR